MNREFFDICQTLTERPDIMELFRVILSAPEDKRPELIRAALEMVEKFTQKGGAV